MNCSFISPNTLEITPKTIANIFYVKTKYHSTRQLDSCSTRKPWQPLRATARVSTSLNCGARPENAGPAQCSFTLIELMAATTVLSVVLLMMVGMQDQMSKAWSNANRRTDATREARAASLLMISDFSFPILRGNQSSTSRDQIADSTTNKGLPFIYSRDGTSNALTIPDQQLGSSLYFCVAPYRVRANSSGDLALVGYYVAKDTFTNANGFAYDSYNLHRYFRPASNAWTNLTNWFSNKAAGNLFPNIHPTNDDILAKNVAGFRILFYNNSTKPITNGVNYTNTGGGGGSYTGNKMQISLTIYPEDTAQKLKLNDWTNSNNVRRFARSFEFRVDSPRE
jgi:type II secretory pathway component PulJ